MTVPLEAPKCPVWPMWRNPEAPFDAPAELVELREERIVRAQLSDGTPSWLVTQYEDQRTILTDERFSADFTRPGYPPVSPIVAEWFKRARPLNAMDNPEHAAVRRTLASAFIVKKMNAARPHIQEIVDGLIDNLLAGEKPVDLMKVFALKVPSIVVCEMLGVSYEDHDEFVATAHVLHDPQATIEEARTAINFLLGYLSRVIEQRMDDPGDDLLGRLITDQYKPGRYTLEQTAGIAFQLLIAGHDTTANMIATGTALLLMHPDQLDLVRKGIAPMDSVVDELLRYVTPAHTGSRRVAIEDVEIGGQVIRAGEGVVLPTVLTNREPGVFENPDKFDVMRSARHHMSFGYGIHQCLGAPLARIELQIAYKTLFDRIPSLKLVDDPKSLKFKRDGIIYGVEKLLVTWDD